MAARTRPNNSAAARKRRAFKPFKPPTRPPAGSYDPALDASVRAAGRGYQDLEQDTQTAGVRSEDDWYRGRNQLGQQRDWSLADLLSGETRLRQDYDLATQGLNRQYGILRSNQSQSANAAGVLGGGWAEQAAAKRAENQKLEQAALTLQRDRGLGDINTQRERTNISADQGLGEIDLTYQRGNEDRSTSLTRAGRENRFFEQDVDASRWFAARGSGYVPPTAPKGQGYRVGADGKKLWYQRNAQGAVLPGGRQLTQGGLRRYLRRRGVR